MGIFSPLETTRLMLRELKKDDLTFIHQYLSDIDVCKYMVFDPLSLKQSKEYVKKYISFQKDLPRKFIKFVLIQKDTNILIGECGITICNFKHMDGELVFRINKLFWGCGFGTEAVKKMIHFGFNDLSLHRIHAFCDIRNEGSIKVLEKAGLQKEGYMREHLNIKGFWRSSYLYACLSQDYINNDNKNMLSHNTAKASISYLLD